MQRRRTARQYAGIDAGRCPARSHRRTDCRPRLHHAGTRWGGRPADRRNGWLNAITARWPSGVDIEPGNEIPVRFDPEPGTIGDPDHAAGPLGIELVTHHELVIDIAGESDYLSSPGESG